MKAPQGKIVKIIPEENTTILVLQREDKSLFCVREYRMNQNHKKWEDVQVLDCHEDGEYESMETRKRYKLYSNEAKTKGTTTQLSVDSEGECKEVKESGIIPLEDKTDLMLTALVQILSYHQQSEPQETLKSVFAYRDALFGGKKQ